MINLATLGFVTAVNDYEDKLGIHNREENIWELHVLQSGVHDPVLVTSRWTDTTVHQ